MRIFIYPSDIQVLTGKSIETCRKLYQSIKDSFEIKPEGLLTIKKYCEYYDLDEKLIQEIINTSPVKHRQNKK